MVSSRSTRSGVPATERLALRIEAITRNRALHNRLRVQQCLAALALATDRVRNRPPEGERDATSSAPE